MSESSSISSDIEKKEKKTNDYSNKSQPLDQNEPKTVKVREIWVGNLPKNITEYIILLLFFLFVFYVYSFSHTQFIDQSQLLTHLGQHRSTLYGFSNFEVLFCLPKHHPAGLWLWL